MEKVTPDREQRRRTGSCRPPGLRVCGAPPGGTRRGGVPPGAAAARRSRQERTEAGGEGEGARSPQRGRASQQLERQAFLTLANELDARET